MSGHAKVWHLLPAPDATAVRQLARAAQISEVVAQLLWQRGIRRADEARCFLFGKLKDLLPPHHLAGVDEAARRIVAAIRDKRKICIYGDYDVDGVTGTAILFRLLRHLQARVEYYVPRRLAEGYGLHADRLRQFHAQGVQMVITVDCGIAALAEAELAQQLGLELIITDHHQSRVDDQGLVLVPPAAVVVHPRIPPGHYPYGDLSGAGVAFKLAWAIAQQFSGTTSGRLPDDLRQILLEGLGLAALGLVADVVPLRGENRLFVRYGLKYILEHPIVGLQALIEVARLHGEKRLKAENIGYHLAPLLNAAGRFDYACLAVDLLTTTSYTQAITHARFLEKLNLQRRQLERQIIEQACEQIERYWQNDPAIVVADTRWHAGIVGIVAARLRDRYGKPVIVIAIAEDMSMAVGSGRSVRELPLDEALRACDGLLEGHGGHPLAAGLKIRPDRIDAFRKAFNHYVARRLPQGCPPSRLVLDAEIPLAAITPALMRELEQLEPCGEDNPAPCFLAVDVAIEQVRCIGKEKNHLSFMAVQGGQRFRCVGWNMANRLEELQNASRVCIAFKPDWNTLNGRNFIELRLSDVQVGSTPQLV
ncbi:MAG: single-stranded-DNA-specific exonuclease RecJ [Gemmataceae bacterium]|nr:single-stranded-DNA-specific exonuclease RecJ [Gemmataceae bacterium]